jgi:hypothetical protein
MWDKKRKQIDGLSVIDGIIIHHSTGSRCNGMSPESVFQIFNTIGFQRGYQKYGYDYKTGYSAEHGQNYHTHNGQISYCMYHYCIYEYEPGVYVLVSLIDNPMETDAGSTNERAVNATAVTVVFAGDFEKDNIPESMIEYFIKLFRPKAPLSWILNKNPDAWIRGHKDVESTACPGRYLYTHLGRINREIDEMRSKA